MAGSSSLCVFFLSNLPSPLHPSSPPWPPPHPSRLAPPTTTLHRHERERRKATPPIKMSGVQTQNVFDLLEDGDASVEELSKKLAKQAAAKPAAAPAGKGDWMRDGGRPAILPPWVRGGREGSGPRDCRGARRCGGDGVFFFSFSLRSELRLALQLAFGGACALLTRAHSSTGDVSSYVPHTRADGWSNRRRPRPPPAGPKRRSSRIGELRPPLPHRSLTVSLPFLPPSTPAATPKPAAASAVEARLRGGDAARGAGPGRGGAGGRGPAGAGRGRGDRPPRAVEGGDAFGEPAGRGRPLGGGRGDRGRGRGGGGAADGRRRDYDRRDGTGRG